MAGVEQPNKLHQNEAMLTLSAQMVPRFRKTIHVTGRMHQNGTDTPRKRESTKRRHALACSVRLQFRPEGDRVGVDVVDQFDYYHLVMTDGNPERASMLALALEHCAKPGDLAPKRYRYRLGPRPTRRLQREDESALRGRSAALKLHGHQ